MNEEWSNFVKDHPAGNIFQTPNMLNVYCKTKNYEPLLILLHSKSEIIGVLLAVIQKEGNGLLGKFTSRAVVIGGPLVKNNDLRTLDEILKEYNGKINNKAIYTQFRNIWNWEEEEKEVFKTNGFNYESHLDIIHDLTLPLENQLAKIHSGRRKNIRRAEKQDISFEEITNFEDFSNSIELIKNTYERAKVPFADHSLFTEAYNILDSQHILKTFVIKYFDQIISIRIVLCFKDLIYDWFAGSCEGYLDKYPNDLLLWKILEWGSKNNYKTFDFGGAGKPNVPYGVRDYKLKFGGELVEFGRFMKTHKPILMYFGQIGLKIYKKLK